MVGGVVDVALCAGQTGAKQEGYERPKTNGEFNWKQSTCSVRAVAALFGTTVFLLLCFPKCWPWCLWLLDMRIWSPWKCIGSIVAMVDSLLVIHLWPSKKRQ